MVFQWLCLASSIVMMATIAWFVSTVVSGGVHARGIVLLASVMVAAAAVKCACSVLSGRTGFLAAREVKHTMRTSLYPKVTRLGPSYPESVDSDEVMQMTSEGVDQLGTYFSGCMPRLLYAVLVPLTLFCYMPTFGVASAMVLLVGVPRGTIVGVTGPGGSGKSTMLRLFMRFRKTSVGSIDISGRSIDHVSTADLRSMESFVAQDTMLFHYTVRNNLVIAKADATDGELDEACRKASVHDVSMGLPHGCDSRVGELCGTLSSGEKRRLGLARAFLHRSELMLLDGPTSNLDSLNETVILRSLQRERGHAAIMLISHRASTMRIVGSVHSVDHGRLG